MPKTRRSKKRNPRTKKQFENVKNAISRAEGNQSLAHFGHVGQDKYKEESMQHEWLKNLGAKKDLQQYINQHYYKYDTKKLELQVRPPITFLYPRKTKRKR